MTTVDLSAADYTVANLAAIRSAIAKGERSVQFADRVVTYRAMQELLDAEERIARALIRRPKQTLVTGNKGF